MGTTKKSCQDEKTGYRRLSFKQVILVNLTNKQDW